MFPYLQIGPYLISNYFLLISLGSLLSALWFILRSEKHGMSRVTAIDLTLISLAAGFVGARLLHVFFEEPQYYQTHPWQIFHVWAGGFVFYGGLIGGFGAAYLFALKTREPFLFWADMAAPSIALAYAIGRFACLLNGCCYGTRCELPWAVVLDSVPRHPTQLYACIWEFTALAILLKLEPRWRTSGALFGAWLILHGCGRALMEHFRDDPRGPLLAGHTLGTWLSLVAIFCGTGLLLTRPWKRAD